MDDYRNSSTIKFLAVKFCAGLTVGLTKWTICKKWKRNSEKFQLLIKSFLIVWNKIFSKLRRMFWSKKCKSNWTSAWNLAFPVFSHLLYEISEKIFIMNRYDFKELHNDQEYYWPTTYSSGAALVSTFTSQGHPTVIFGKISVRKTIWELEFSEHLL